MKQLLQNMRDGKAIVADVAVPSVRPGMALVKTAVSLVSAGTERMVVKFAEKSLLGKARSRPDLVKQMVEKARKEGLISAVEAAFNRLDQPMALGYSSAGTIIEIGENLSGFTIGDRVACAGAGYAVHAEYALVPQNLLIKLPAQVDFESAAFATLGAIAMHGFRLAQPQLGESVAVIGLGLLGLLSVNIAKAAGCSVFGVDLDPERVKLAQGMGAVAVLRDEAESAGVVISQGRGFDIVLITADTSSDDPVLLAGTLSRDRGRVVAVGAVGLNIPRKIYYEKELSFQVSRSYGPGRYDAQYEEKGHDYPIGYIRWTEGRNLQSFVELCAGGQIDVHSLISHRFDIKEAAQAYQLISGKGKEPFLGVLLTYPQESKQETKIIYPSSSLKIERRTQNLTVGVLGAGNYASAVFLPVIHHVGEVNLAGIASSAGLSAQHAARKFGFSFSSSNEDDILGDPDINLVVILTRHNNHALLVMEALHSGKHVYCEKPLAIHPEELKEITSFLNTPNLPLLMVGFNRRFAPLSIQLKDFLDGRREPLAAHYRINAGYIPLTHWTQNSQVGGGRIIGEGCHFIDFLCFLTGQIPTSISAKVLPDGGRFHQDNMAITAGFPDGSIGTIHYLANGDKSFPKERLEVFSGGKITILDDFRSLELVQNGKRRVRKSLLRQDKGHRAAWLAFLQSIRSGGPAPILYEHLIGVTQASFAAVRSSVEQREISIG